MASKTIPLHRLPFEVNKIGKNIETWAKRTGVNGPRKAGMFMIRLAKRLAPSYTGRTEKGIKGKKFGKGYMVSSSAINPRSGFPYNFWTDNRVSIRGMGSYRTRQRTGVEGGGYFTIATKETAKKFKDMVVKDVNKLELVK